MFGSTFFFILFIARLFLLPSSFRSLMTFPCSFFCNLWERISKSNLIHLLYGRDPASLDIQIYCDRNARQSCQRNEVLFLMFRISRTYHRDYWLCKFACNIVHRACADHIPSGKQSYRLMNWMTGNTLGTSVPQESLWQTLHLFYFLIVGGAHFSSLV